MHDWNRRGFLAGMSVLAATPAWAGGPNPLPNPIGADNAVVDAFVKAHGFTGVIMLGRRGEPTYARAFGMAEVETRRAATVDTPYALASISKWLTSVTVLRLVEQGRLDLDAPIGTWLKDYRADTGMRVRLKHLLSNTSGIPNQFNPKADPTLWTKAFTTTEAIKAFCSGDAVSDPGTKFAYDLTNWILVKGIVEAVSGRDFAETVRMLTLAPLGLTGVSPGYESDGRLAAAYASLDPPVRKMNPRSRYTLASGGYVGTAPDLLRAAHRVYDTGFLTPKSLRELSAVLVPDQDYALGGRVKTLDVAGAPRRFAWETGRVDGYRSLLAHRLDDGNSLVLLNNNDLSQATIDRLGYALFGASGMAPPAAG